MSKNATGNERPGTFSGRAAGFHRSIPHLLRRMSARGRAWKCSVSPVAETLLDPGISSICGLIAGCPVIGAGGTHRGTQTVRLGVSLVSCGAEIPPTGNNDQDQVAKEHPDQPADENRPIVRFRGLPANPTDKPSDEGAESGSRHRIDARGKEEEYSLVNC